MSGRHVAIVGGGYTGALLAWQLLDQGAARVSLIERGGPAGLGVAYGTPHDVHLLNVPAARMSAFPDRPAHFADWFAAKGGVADDFAPRRLYGAYVREILGQCDGRLDVMAGEAVDIVVRDGGETVLLADGRRIAADIAVLAVGNFAPAPLPGLSVAALPGIYVPDPWGEDLAAGLGWQDQVVLIGTGLTAIDAALMLDEAGFRGPTLALSRRGLAPRAHEKMAARLPPPASLPRSLAALLGQIRADAEQNGWRAAVDRIRPVTQALWAGADQATRARFLRHLRPWWDVHRHRIAPAIAARIARMEADGRLAFRAGRIMSAHVSADMSADMSGRAAELAWRPRGSEDVARVTARRIVNCTGPEANIARSGDPLLTRLIDEGRIRPDALGLGIDVDAALATLNADGRSNACLCAVGPMTRGALWEIVAVPDIRGQVAALAGHIARA